MARNFSAGNTLNCGNPAELQVFNTNDFTLTGICHPTSLPASGVQQVVAKRGANITTICFELGFWNQKLRFAVSNGTTYVFIESGALGATPGVCRVIGVCQGGSIRLYLNSSSAVATGSLGIDMTNLGANFRIGRDDQGSEFVGRIAEVAVWRKALADAEFAALMNGVSPLAFRRDELRGYWPVFGASSPEPDLSGKGSNAALVGTPSLADHFLVQRYPLNRAA